MDSKIKYIKDADYQAQVDAADGLVIVDFMAQWCAPCHQMAPVLEEIAQEFPDGLTIGKMDVDKDPEVAKRLGIRGLPTLLFVKNGKEVGREIGVLTKTQLASIVEGHIETE